MTTFSQLVDKAMSEVKRPDMVKEITEYLNQTIREVHANPDTKLVAFFPGNLKEDRITAISNAELIWDIPNPTTFQRLLAVRFDNVYGDENDQLYAKERTPGRGMNNDTEYWYRAGNYVSFNGFGGLDATVSLAWYEYPRQLKYKVIADRKVMWDEESGWTYADGLTAEQIAQADLFERNWILDKWDQVLLEGLRAKVYKRIGDDTRAARCYSFFQTERVLLWSSEDAVYDSWR